MTDIQDELVLERELPTGVTDFHAMIDRIMKTYPLPTASETDVKFIIASTILNMPSNTTKAPDKHFVDIIKASAAKQIASYIFQEIKIKQKADDEAAKIAAEKAKNESQGSSVQETPK